MLTIQCLLFCRRAPVTVTRALLMTGALVLATKWSLYSFANQAAPQNEIVIEDCRVGYATQVAVPALESGPLQQVPISENAVVLAGQTLAVLDQSPLLIRRRVAELRRTLLSERLDNRLEVEFAETAYQEAVEANKIDEGLYSRNPGAVPLTTVRKSRLTVKRAELEREQVDKNRREAELELEAHLAELSNINAQLQRTEAKSPINGVVLKLHKTNGEWVNQGEEIATVAALDTLAITAFVDETQLSLRQAVGTAVTVRWTENGNTLTLRGIVKSVDPEIREVHNLGKLRLHVHVENRPVEGGWLLYPGRKVILVLHPLAQDERIDPATARRLGVEQGRLR